MLTRYFLFPYSYINFLLFLALSCVENIRAGFAHIFNAIYKFVSYKADIRRVENYTNDVIKVVC